MSRREFVLRRAPTACESTPTCDDVGDGATMTGSDAEAFSPHELFM